MKHRLLPRLSALCAPLGIAALSISSASAATISQYSLEELTGTTASQSIGGGAPNGTLVGAASWTAGIAPGSASALSLGSGGRVEVAGSSVWNGLSGFSVSTWIRPSQFAPTGTGAASIFWMGTSAGSARFTIQLNDLADLRVGGRRIGTEPNFNTSLVTGSNATGTNNGSAGDPIQLGQTYHVAATADYTTGLLSLYLNGNLISSATIAAWGTGTTATDQSLIIRLGSNASGGEQFQGTIDDVRLFNTALTASEIAALAVPEPAATLLAGLGAIAWTLGARRRRPLI